MAGIVGLDGHLMRAQSVDILFMPGHVHHVTEALRSRRHRLARRDLQWVRRLNRNRPSKCEEVLWMFWSCQRPVAAF